MERRVALYCDIHGHSRKKNVFMYGCHSPSSDIYSHRNNSLIRLIPYLMSQWSKIFCYNDCKFANEKEKEATARIVLFKEFGIVNSYTIESTFYGSDFLKESHPSNNSSNLTANALTSGVPTSISGNTGNNNKRSVSSEKKHSKQTIEKLNNMIVS